MPRRKVNLSIRPEVAEVLSQLPRGEVSEWVSRMVMLGSREVDWALEEARGQGLDDYRIEQVIEYASRERGLGDIEAVLRGNALAKARLHKG